MTDTAKAGARSCSRFLSPDDGSGAEITAAVGAVIGSAPRREPALAAPGIALAGNRFEDRNPPVEQNENQQSDDPTDHGPHRIVNPEQEQPETAVSFVFAREHGARTAAPRAFDVQRHSESLPSF